MNTAQLNRRPVIAAVLTAVAWVLAIAPYLVVPGFAGGPGGGAQPPSQFEAVLSGNLIYVVALTALAIPLLSLATFILTVRLRPPGEKGKLLLFAIPSVAISTVVILPIFAGMLYVAVYFWLMRLLQHG